MVGVADDRIDWGRNVHGDRQTLPPKKVCETRGKSELWVLMSWVSSTLQVN